MMFKLSNTLFATTIALFMVGSANAAYTSARRGVALAPNPVDACNGHNDYGVGHSCAFSTSLGTSQGTCQLDGSGNLYCAPNPARRSVALAPNPVDACNGHNDYGVGHSCAFSTSWGTSQGTCQLDTSSNLYCAPNPARRSVALAPNPVDACNGHNDYGVGHSCAFSTGWGTSQGTCQLDSSSNLYCAPNPARRSVALAPNPVDACNGHNDYGVGHSCAFSSGSGTSQGTCQIDGSGIALYCAVNPARRSIALAANPVDACNGHNNYGVGHSCAFSSAAGKSEGTCQIDGSGIALYCEA